VVGVTEVDSSSRASKFFPSRPLSQFSAIFIKRFQDDLLNLQQKVNGKEKELPIDDIFAIPSFDRMQVFEGLKFATQHELINPKEVFTDDSGLVGPRGRTTTSSGEITMEGDAIYLADATREQFSFMQRPPSLRTNLEFNPTGAGDLPTMGLDPALGGVSDANISLIKTLGEHLQKMGTYSNHVNRKLVVTWNFVDGSNKNSTNATATVGLGNGEKPQELSAKWPQ
jgi:hypothetical protein